MEISSRTGEPAIRVGDQVKVRQERWIVAEVEPQEGCTILTLTATAPHAPDTLRVLAPFDDVRREDADGAPQWVTAQRWRRACRASIAANGPAGILRTAQTARIDLLPYQLEPALALLRGHGARLLIADEVGLGKTVQAALAAAELRASGAASRVLIVCPAGLRDQWVDECRARFGLSVTLFDQAALRRARASLPSGVNPWTLQPCVVTSVDYLKRPEVLPLVLDATWDVVIVDEAHGSAGPSDRHDAVHELCRYASYVLLLTATPHSGDDDAFASLCGVGALDDRVLVFRRSRAEAGRASTRRIHTLRVRASPAEMAMHVALHELTEAVRREGTHQERQVWLLLSLLHKRACSSPYALAESTARRLQVLEGDGNTAGSQLWLPLDDSGELDDADDAPMWAMPALHDTGRERGLLRALVSAARAAETADSKLQRLARLLRSVREPVIVFTEYRDTLLHVHRRVAPHAAMVHGGMPRDERRAALASFSAAGVLLATDAAGEGLNLQRDSRCVVSLELPWNPMRLEQRIGRVDRIGQARRVHAFHLVSADTGETRLLERLAARLSRAALDIGAPDPLGALPAWTEVSSARTVMGMSAAGPMSRPGATAPAPALLSLAGDAERECHRLGLVRALSPRTPVRPSDAPPRAGAPLVAWSNRRRTRVATGGRAVAMFRSVMSDASGRVVAEHLTPVSIDLASCSREAVDVIAAVRAEPYAMERDAWVAESTLVQRRIAEVRQRRALAASALLAPDRRGHQPGLFDRRAERRRVQAERERTDRLARVEARLRDARAQALVTVSAPALILLLLPGRPAPRR